jgi:hypothetical protein
MPSSRERRILIGRGIPAAAAAGIVVAAFWPVSRSTGVNHVVSRSTLPMWKKASEFLARGGHLEQTADLALGHVSGEEPKALAALAWTRANITHAPPDRPVIDDHIWNVIVRGYGQADQLADVFTTLLTYQGVPAFWSNVGRSPMVNPVSYVWIAHQWRVFDVARGLIFRTESGALATAADLAADPGIVRRTAQQARLADLDGYLALFEGYRPPDRPDILRAELQMPRRRLAFELCHGAGLSCGATRTLTR